MKLIKRIEEFGKWIAEPAWFGTPRATFVIPLMLVVITILIVIGVRL